MGQIARTLASPAGAARWPDFRSARQHETRPEAPTRTDLIRQLLRDSGPRTAQQIAIAVDLESTGLVGALLKGDIARGSVRFMDGRYAWCEAFDRELEAQIAQAAALLRRHGYSVRRVGRASTTKNRSNPDV